MTVKEGDRFRLLKNYAEGAGSLKDIANCLKISCKHVKRLWRSFKINGLLGIISKKHKNQNRSL